MSRLRLQQRCPILLFSGDWSLVDITGVMQKQIAISQQNMYRTWRWAWCLTNLQWQWIIVEERWCFQKSYRLYWGRIGKCIFGGNNEKWLPRYQGTVNTVTSTRFSKRVSCVGNASHTTVLELSRCENSGAYWSRLPWNFRDDDAAPCVQV